MTKADDSSLDPEQLRAVELRARNLLDRASGWGRYPTPIDDILSAASLRVADKQAFDPAGLIAFMASKGRHAAALVKSALSKVFGIYDAGDEIIHIDESVTGSKQTFLKLHEAGHHEMPAHRKLFRFFQDCEKTLSPEVADLFEREANNFARFALFQGDGFRLLAADCDLSVKVPMKLASKFGASVYASAREFARTHHRDCLVIVLNPIEYRAGVGMRAPVRRIEASPSFRAKFPVPEVDHLTLDHPLGKVLPSGRQRVVKPKSLSMRDRNGVAHECVAEAFNTTHNIIILLYPVKALTATTIIMPAGLIDAV
jgi:hypothetical protein